MAIKQKASSTLLCVCVYVYIYIYTRTLLCVCVCVCIIDYQSNFLEVKFQDGKDTSIVYWFTYVIWVKHRLNEVVFTSVWNFIPKL